MKWRESMKATLFLRKDHETIRELFSEYRRAKGVGNGKRALFERIRKELVVHSQIEIELFYPELEAITGESEGRIKAALQEDRQIKKSLSDLISGSENEKQLESKVAGLIEKMSQHIDEEEALFDEIRKNLSEQRLEELGLE